MLARWQTCGGGPCQGMAEHGMHGMAWHGSSAAGPLTQDDVRDVPVARAPLAAVLMQRRQQDRVVPAQFGFAGLSFPP